MDANTFSLYIHELRNQCMYSEAALGLFNQGLEKQSSTAVFFAVQTFMTSTSNISRLLWPNRLKAKRRGEELRKTLGLPADFPLGSDRLHNFWEMGDERTDDWIKNSRGHVIAFDFLGPKNAIGNRQPKDEHIYRLYDPESKTFIYRGELFNLQDLAGMVALVAERVNAAHDQLFPKAKQAPAPSPQATEPAAETTEAPKA
jgi:hypothetical protein